MPRDSRFTQNPDPRGEARVRRGYVGRFGGAAIATALLARDLARTLGGAVASIFAPGLAAREVVRRVFVLQIFFSGVQALALVSVIALLIGATIIIQVYLNAPGAPGDVVAKVLAAVVVRELAPLGTAIVLSGRSGTAIATELGNMRVNSEIHALRSLGIDPRRYIVLPRIGAAVVTMLVLPIYFSVVALIGGFVVARLIVSPSFEALRSGFSEALRPADLVLYLTKCIGLGGLIGLFACHFGLSVSTSPTEVPQKASRAVVLSLLGCVVWSTAVTIGYYALFGPPIRV